MGKTKTMAELTTREKKIIDDILFHLDGWRTNDVPYETRKIESFLDLEDPLYDNNIRKEVSSREVLKVYDMAKIHALNYIRRKEFPNSPAIYQAICYWAAGLLSEKSHFKDESIEKSTLLIEEARRLLDPHRKKSQDFFIVSGDDFFWEEYMRSERHPHPRRDRIPDDDWDGDEPKEPSIHGRFHEHYPERFHYKPPRKPKGPCMKPAPHLNGKDGRVDWFKNKQGNKYNIKLEPITSEDGNTVVINAGVTRFGKPVNHGKLMYYQYVDGSRKLIGSSVLTNGLTEHVWVLDEDMQPGEYMLYISYVGGDDYVLCEKWETMVVKIPVSIQFTVNELNVNTTIDPSEPEIVLLEVNVMRDGDVPVNSGMVQFLVKTDNSNDYVKAGSPVNVVEGIASYEYSIPYEFSYKIYVKAVYLGSQVYGNNVSNNILTLTTKKRVSLVTSHLTTTPGETETITIYIMGENEEVINDGYIDIYLDNTPVKRISSIETNPLMVSYTFADDISGGSHELKLVYSGSDEFASQVVTADVNILRGVVIVSNPIYAPQTVEDNGSIIVGTATIPVNIIDLEGNAVPYGIVEFNCDNVTDTITLDESVTPEFTFNIPMEYVGGDTIPFTLTYIENENYPRTKIHSQIIIKYNVNVEVDEVNGNQGDTVTLGANVTDENSNPINNGEVEFGLEQEPEEENGE